MLQAVERGYYDVVKCLVEHGADVNLGNKNGNTPLKRAIRNGYVCIAEYLVKQGASVPTDTQSLIKEGIWNVEHKLKCLLKK